jgi:SAM-dependent methyltransferase
MSELGKSDLVKPAGGQNQPEKNGAAGRSTARRGAWQAPAGVAAGTWDYVNRDHIGDQYDSFVSGEPLSAVDRKIISRYLHAVEDEGRSMGSGRAQEAPIVVDFGCGTGRTLLPLIRDGYRGLAVDLSESMLANLSKNLSNCGLEQTRVSMVLANLVELSCLADHVADHGVCMLSTLGMIQGSTNRAKFLAHARRIIRPDGRLFVHAHNYFYQWRHPGGVQWAAANLIGSFQGSEQMGDRLATYRNVSGMFIHQFRRAELGRALTDAGFPSQEWFGVEAGSAEPVPIKRWHNPFRFVGWVVVGSV